MGNNGVGVSRIGNIEFQNIGNVSFKKEDVVKYEPIKEKGVTKWSVFLKNGTKIVFSEQKPDTGANVYIGYDLMNNNKYGTGFWGIKGLSIEGTSEDDYYYVQDCDLYSINIKGGGQDEVRAVHQHGSPQFKHYEKDDTDNTYRVTRPSVFAREIPPN